MTVLKRPVEGFTPLRRPRQITGYGGGAPSGWILEDTSGNAFYLWFDTLGQLRAAAEGVANLPGFDWNSGGTILGAGVPAFHHAQHEIGGADAVTSIGAANGTAVAPTIAFAAETGLGFYRPQANFVATAVSGAMGVGLDASVHIGTGGSLAFTSGAANGVNDTLITRSGAGTVRLTGTTPMLQLGGTNNTVPALKRNNAILEARLADDSAYAAFNAGLVQGFGGGAFGYLNTVATTSAGPVVGNMWIPRVADFGNLVMLDYQDEYAYIDGRGATVASSPAANSGTGPELFHDDTTNLQWNAGTTGGQVQITIDHTAAAAIVPNRNNNSFQIGLTLRSNAEIPTHIKIEAWNTATGGSFATVYDQNVTIFGGPFGAWVSPLFASPDASANMYKTRITLSGLPDPLTNFFRVQRVLLYHPTAPWDMFHLGIGGGRIYGALQVPDGAVGTPSLTFASETNTGLYKPGAGLLGLVTGGGLRLAVRGNDIAIPSNGSFSFTNTANDASATMDTQLTRNGAGKLTLTGTTPMIQFGGTSVSFPALKQVSANIEVRTADDASYSGFVADIYAFGPGRGAIRQGGSDGVFTLYNNALTDFGRLQFGGTTSSFPALKRAGATLQVRLADDSASAALLVAGLTINNGSLSFANLLASVTAPTIGSGFGTSPSVPSNNGTASFTVNVGTGGTASSGVITMPAATTGWIAYIVNITATAANRANVQTVQTASTTTSITVQSQTISTGAAVAWAASDILRIIAFAY